MPRKFYAVRIGRRPGVYDSWPACRRQIDGVVGAKYKSFQSREEADWFVNRVDDHHDTTGEDPTAINVYTDGSSMKTPRVAGFGIWSPDKPRWKTSESMGREFGGERTNQRAEVAAILRLLLIMDRERIPLDQRVIVYTDSKYAINAITKWTSGWRMRGWMTLDGRDVKHADLFIQIHPLYSLRRHSLIFKHVYAHANRAGNEQADRLAKAGAMKDTPAVEADTADTVSQPSANLTRGMVF